MAGQPQAAAGSSERVLIGNGLPTVPKKLLQKIRNWEYVELAELLPTANPSASSGLPSARFQLLPGLDVVRQRKRQNYEHHRLDAGVRGLRGSFG